MVIRYLLLFCGLLHCWLQDNPSGRGEKLKRKERRSSRCTKCPGTIRDRVLARQQQFSATTIHRACSARFPPESRGAAALLCSGSRLQRFFYFSINFRLLRSRAMHACTCIALCAGRPVSASTAPAHIRAELQHIQVDVFETGSIEAGGEGKRAAAPAPRRQSRVESSS